MPIPVSVKATAEMLLAAAGVEEDHEFYGPFTDTAEKAVLAVPQMIKAAWAANDAAAFARVFVKNGSLLMRDEQLTSRDQIHAHMAAGFRGGPYKGARVTGWPLSVQFLDRHTAVVVTQGGILFAGDEELHPEREIRATWVIVARNGRWRLLSHHSSPVRGPSGPPASASAAGKPSRHGESNSEEIVMPSNASQLVAAAKEWAGLYGEYSNGIEGAVLTVPLRVRAAWERNDPDALASVFTENGSMLVGDEQLMNREEIRAYLAKAFAGNWKGTRLEERPLQIKLLSDDAAVAITEGGVLRNGDTEVAHHYRTVWVTAKQDGEWQLVSYQSSPVSN